MRRIICCLLGLLVLTAISCSDDNGARSEDSGGPTSVPTATTATSVPSKTATAADRTSTATTTAAMAVTRDALIAVGDQVFPHHAESGVYSVCGADGDVSACPYTQRLKDRLEEAKATLCRCQNPSQTRAMSAEVADFGGVLYAALYNGTQSYMITVVQNGGRLLVDDQTCMSGAPETSIYQSLAPCS
jgi:hypothetical protein